MNRFPRMVTALVGLGLMLTACVPLDGNRAGPSSPSHTIPGGKAPSSIAASPRQQYPTDGLQERIASLSRDSVAYQLQQGNHPLDDAVQESEEVILAERFPTSSNFALPQDATGNRLHVELECSRKTNYEITVFFSDGAMLGNAMASE